MQQQNKKRLNGSQKIAKVDIVKRTVPKKILHQSPDESLGELFSDVQAQRVYSDGKTFADSVPRGRAIDVVRTYKKASKEPGFNLQQFVNDHFDAIAPRPRPVAAPASRAATARQYVAQHWYVLTQQNPQDQGSLIALPQAYIAPGGRFNEQFYWDSYFIMLGLAADHKWQMVENMVKNHAYMVRKFGFIPTANRSYFLSRSQPPFFVYMVKLLAGHKGRLRTCSEYLPFLVQEYRFWMAGKNVALRTAGQAAFDRVVVMPNGTVLNRYFDSKARPRPESHLEDIKTAEHAAGGKKKLFVNLRAAAESGWDFSSRWFNDDKLDSIITTNIVPVDLNSLLYMLERTIGETYSLLGQPAAAKRFLVAAEKRAQAIRRYCWDGKQQFFVDYNFKKGRCSRELTLAGVYPLFTKIATQEQAAAVAQRLEKEFLKPGGLVATLKNTGEQWDAPNGWAPLHWVAIKGLREYGFFALANKIRDRWLATNEQVFALEHKMIEKYDVVTAGQLGRGGEYPLQDGFGWTNGVYAALFDEKQRGH